MAVIIFDFDGTIANSRDLIINIIAREAKKYPLTDSQRHDLYGLTTIGIVKQFRYPWWRMLHLLTKGRSTMARSMRMIKPYDGIVSVIRKIHAEGHQIFIVSSNNVSNISKFLSRHHLNKKILSVYGGIEVFGKAKTYRELIKDFRLEDENIICIGDEVKDIVAAKAVNFRTIAVSWGFSGRENLSALKPDWLVDKPKQILEIIEQL